MASSSIYVSSKTGLGNLENFLESARGKDIVIEDKYRKSTGSIRFGVREKDSNSAGRAEDKAKTRQALYQAISTVLKSNNRTAALSFLRILVQPSGNPDALFSTGTTQLKPEVLEKLFQSNLVFECSPPGYKPGGSIHVVDRTLPPAEYLSLPITTKALPTPREIANNARSGEIAREPSNPQFASIFVKDFERMAKSGAYRLESIDGQKRTCHTLAEFAEFVGPGNQKDFKNGANLVTVVSYLTSQNLPLFLNAAILKSPDTPITSVNGGPLFFKADLKSSYDLKKMADGGITLTYKGECRPDELRISPDHTAPSITLRRPGLAKIECNIIFRPNGDVEYGNVRVHAEGLHL